MKFGYLMKDLIYQKIDTLPPLPKTILDLEEFRNLPEKKPEVLLNIIMQDPLIVATLLKIANSSMFGFKSSIETPKRAILLLGINFTLSIAFSTSIKNLIKTDLEAYGISSSDFMELTNMSSNLLSLWLAKQDMALRDELLLPVFLQETGKFIISDIIMEQNQRENFLQELQSCDDIAVVEKKYLTMSSSEVTATIFKKWHLNEKLINSIEFVDDLTKAPQAHLNDAVVLNIIKTICNITAPMSEKSIQKGLEKAKKYGFEEKNLKSAVEQMQLRIQNSL